MTYSFDLRQRVVAFVASGGSKVAAKHLFGVGRSTIYEWLALSDLKPKAHGPRQRKLDRQALRRHVADHPDALLRERAAHFKVHVNAVWEALQGMRINVKKNAAVPGKRSRQADRVSAKATRYR